MCKTVYEAGIAMIDVDNFKLYNDVFGHRAGDVVLETMAQSVKLHTASGDLLVRLGGDEFVMLLEEDASDGVEALLERWNVLLAEARASSGLPLSVAVGWARGAGRDAEQLVKQADAEMYRNKREGKQG